MSREDVRVRFAPSPTGPLHIGGLRTALYNYLFARKSGGSFILRIEDTDRKRFVEGTEAYISEALHWCGIPYDEGPDKPGNFGPYRQSERQNLYTHHAEALVEKGCAYYAFDRPEDLEAHRKSHETRGKTFIYNWHNRMKLTNSLALPAAEVRERLDGGEEYVLRFKVPEGERLLLRDSIRGEVLIDSNTLDDKILFKSDGMPTYHLANVVDDHLMAITHVIRGEEWLPSLALHHLLYEAFGWKAPVFAHLPLILNPGGKGKLSKRDGHRMGFPVYPLQWDDIPGYREEGYFPETLVNVLALLGWNPGTTQELFSLSELVQAFSLDRVHSAGARFDPEKTKWYNHNYLQKKEDRELVAIFLPLLREKLSSRSAAAVENHPLPTPDYVERVISLIKDRATFVREFWEMGAYFFIPPASYEEQAVKRLWKEETPSLMKALYDLLEALPEFSGKSAEAAVKQWISGEGLAFGKVMAPLRLALVGGLQGPDLFQIMGLLGKRESLERIRRAAETLK